VVHLYFILCRNTLVFFSWCYAFQVAYSCSSKHFRTL
jgi:hypothetical protein